jgi:long-chain-fatty-acid--CoA ligase ACSBG
LILNRIKGNLGLDKAKQFYYGAAPLRKSTIEYFASLDMPLLNAYGMSETMSGVTVQSLEKFSLAAAGYVIDGMEVKIFNPDENGSGEICMRGRSIMAGYLKNEAATKETIDN